MPLNLLADIAGPMARTVEDAVAVFQVIVGEDPDDPVRRGTRDAATSVPADARDDPELRASLGSDGLKGARIGMLRQAYERDTTDPEIVKVFMTAVDDLKRAGAVIVDPVRVDLDEVRRPQGAGTCGGSSTTSTASWRRRATACRCKSLADDHPVAPVPPVVQRRLEQAQEGTENGPDTPACKAEAEYREPVRAAVLKTMDANKLDAFVYPTWSNPPRLIGDLNTPHGDNSQFFSPTTGFPPINVPMGYTRGSTLPAGITFFGRAWDEGGAHMHGLFVRAGDKASEKTVSR